MFPRPARVELAEERGEPLAVVEDAGEDWWWISVGGAESLATSKPATSKRDERYVLDPGGEVIATYERPRPFRPGALKVGGESLGADWSIWGGRIGVVRERTEILAVIPSRIGRARAEILHDGSLPDPIVAFVAADAIRQRREARRATLLIDSLISGP